MTKFEELYAKQKEIHAGNKIDNSNRLVGLIERLFFQDEKTAGDFARLEANKMTPDDVLRGEFKPDAKKISALAEKMIAEAREVMHTAMTAKKWDPEAHIGLNIPLELYAVLFAYGTVRRALLKDRAKGVAQITAYIGTELLKRERNQLKLMQLLIDYDEHGLTGADDIHFNAGPSTATTDMDQLDI